MKLSNLIVKTIFGAALAGVGFSVGKDLYATGAKNPNTRVLILALVVAIAAVFGLFWSGLTFFRNYRNMFVGVWMRCCAIVVYFASFYFATIGLSILIGLGLASLSSDNADILRLILPIDFVNQTVEIRSYVFQFIYGAVNVPFDQTRSALDANGLSNSYYIWFGNFAADLIFLSGIFVGWRQRIQRNTAWQIEKANEEFISENQIEVLDDLNIVDADGNRYRMENVFQDRIEWFALGKRMKRAYLDFDHEGRYTHWSGLVSI